DIMEQLEDIVDNDVVIIPSSMLKTNEDIFLDGITLNELQGKLNKRIVKCEVNGKLFIKTIREVGTDNYD
ncbi:MAG: DUF512 domain-containing protein, partial [Thermoanaerobacteraceae bacterium]|nr:DUF512 domain-containing protein [Thermoanaerobacteraceae bacterium]